LLHLTLGQVRQRLQAAATIACKVAQGSRQFWQALQCFATVDAQTLEIRRQLRWQLLQSDAPRALQGGEARWQLLWQLLQGQLLQLFAECKTQDPAAWQLWKRLDVRVWTSQHLKVWQ
jgi:hypothetical protein